jgi:hypothetical protein
LLRPRFFGNPDPCCSLCRFSEVVSMPIFYFNVRGEGLDQPDLAGRDCADEAAARAEAERMALELAEAAVAAGRPPPEATVEVDDAEMRPLLALPIAARGG